MVSMVYEVRLSVKMFSLSAPTHLSSFASRHFSSLLARISFRRLRGRGGGQPFKVLQQLLNTLYIVFCNKMSGAGNDEIRDAFIEQYFFAFATKCHKRSFQTFE